MDDKEIAFKVLAENTLAIAVNGEAIFKPFGKDITKQRPNGIVYPTQRINVETISNILLHDKTEANFKSNHNKYSEENLHKTNSKNQNDVIGKTDLGNNTLKPTNAKLKQPDHLRKPFITTVKKGQFLQPPPETNNGWYRKREGSRKCDKKIYTYASTPRVLDRSSVKGHISRCDAAAASIISTLDKQYSQRSKRDVNSNINTKIEDEPLPYANLMFEKRVFRGSNYAMPHVGDGESAAARAAEARRRALARCKAKNQQIKGAELRLKSPPPVHGRRHEPVQTELYLEEIFDHPPVEDRCTQTDLFLDRPKSPFYVPRKTGADVATQICPGDLFDYDMEVQPILEVLVGKTIEQALIEVLEEEELAALREQQRRFLELRAAETSEAQRLEALERRLQLEKGRRLSDYEEGMRRQKEMEERIAASVLVQGYMADLLPSVLEGLEESGFLTDNIKQDVDDSFMPWLMKEVTQELQEMVSSRDVLTDIVREVLENRAELYRALYEDKLKRISDGEEEEEGGPTLEDLNLQEHCKLIAEANAGMQKEETQ